MPDDVRSTVNLSWSVVAAAMGYGPKAELYRKEKDRIYFLTAENGPHDAMVPPFDADEIRRKWEGLVVDLKMFLVQYLDLYAELAKSPYRGLLFKQFHDRADHILRCSLGAHIRLDVKTSRLSSDPLIFGPAAFAWLPNGQLNLIFNPYRSAAIYVEEREGETDVSIRRILVISRPKEQAQASVI